MTDDMDIKILKPGLPCYPDLALVTPCTRYIITRVTEVCSLVLCGPVEVFVVQTVTPIT